MNPRAVSNALSHGQLLLFEETPSRHQVLYRPRKTRKHPLRPDLRKVALGGLTLGFFASILVQSLWPHLFR